MGKLTRKNIRKKRNITSRVNLKDKKKGGSAIMGNEKNEIFPVIDDFKIYRRGEGGGNVPFDIPFEWSDNLLEDCFGIPEDEQNKLIETLPKEQQYKNQYIIHLLQPLKKRLPFYIDRFVEENNDANIVDFNQLSQYEKIENFISKLYRYYEEDIECSNMVGDIGEAFIVFKYFALRIPEGENMEETNAVETIIDNVQEIADEMKYKIFGVSGELIADTDDKLNSCLFTLPFPDYDEDEDLYGEYYADNRLGVGGGYNSTSSHKTNYHDTRYTTMYVDPFDLIVGSDVFALGGDGYFYHGKITKINDKKYIIKFTNDATTVEKFKREIIPEQLVIMNNISVEFNTTSDGNWDNVASGLIEDINVDTYKIKREPIEEGEQKEEVGEDINKKNVRIEENYLREMMYNIFSSMDSEMIQDYLIGSDVFALGNENYFYPGTITKVNDDTFMIQFYNTDLGKNEINKDDVFPEGTGVNVEVFMASEWSADSDEIKTINQDGTYSVES